MPLSLVLEYQRDVSREDIRKATWSVLRKQHATTMREPLRAGIEALQDAMVDVTEAVYGAEIRMARMSGQAMAAQPLASELALAKSLGAPGILRGQLYTLADLEQGDSLPDEHFRLASDTLVIRDWKEMQDAYH